MFHQRWTALLAGPLTLMAFLPSAAVRGAETITVIARDHNYFPSRIVVSPGERASVTLYNAGSVPHNIEFELPGGEAEFEEPVPPGQKRTLTFTAPEKTGSYVYYCPIANHRALGMEGVLFVGAAADAPPPKERPSPRPRAAGGENIFGLKNQHGNLTSGIKSSNVGTMKLAWSVKTSDFTTHTPIVHNGRVYFADWGGDVYAVDARTGKLIWKKTGLEKPMKKWPWHGFAGTGAIGEGMLFEASVEGNAFALDAATGEVKWTTRIAEDPQAGNVGALLYHDGLVYVGLQSVEEPLTAMMKDFKPDFQGKVLALDAGTGKKVWERRLVAPPKNGVAMWSAFALDPEMNALFFTTGNNYTGEPSELADALVAVNARTGEILWSRQVTQHDVWVKARPLGPDYDFGAGPQLFEANSGGAMRKLVGAGQKSGVYYAWDRRTGAPVWSTVVGYGGVGGGIHGEASVGDGKIYAWSNNSYTYGAPPEKNPINIKALDAATGRPVWIKPNVQPAVLTSAGYLAGDAYFVGSLDGQVRAYRASDGELLWTSQRHGAVGSSLVVADDMLLFATGVPKMFAGGPATNGVFAYTPNPSGVANAASGAMP